MQAGEAGRLGGRPVPDLDGPEGARQPDGPGPEQQAVAGRHEHPVVALEGPHRAPRNPRVVPAPGEGDVARGPRQRAVTVTGHVHGL